MRPRRGDPHTMIRLLHAADLHLDSPFQALDGEKAAQRRAEQRRLLARIADLARERGADLAIFAGDLLDSEDVFSETGGVLTRALSSMGIPVFIAPGNHDWYGPRSVWARLALTENVHLFTEEAVTNVPLPELGVRVWGAAFTGPRRSPPLAAFEAAKDGDTLDIMALHGEVGSEASPYGAITEDELARSGMDYVALGHIHRFSGLRRAGDTFYAWPGCPEGRGFDETGEKGVILAELAPGHCRLEFIPVAARRYEIAEVELTNAAAAEAAAGTLAAILAALPADTTADIYRLRLTGQTDTPPNLNALRRALEGRFFALDLRDETTPRRDIWAERGGDSLKGLFLSLLWDRLNGTTDGRERARIRQAAVYGLAAMERGDAPPLT